MITPKSLFYRTKTKINQKLTDDRYVFMLVDSHKLDTRRLDDETSYFFGSVEDVPQDILQTLPRTPDMSPAELTKKFDLGLRLSVMMVGNNFGCLAWSRTGAEFDWIVPILPNDLLIGRAFTNPDMRGQGLRGRLLSAQIKQEFEQRVKGGRVLSDCHVNNTAAVRQFLKRGSFRLVARVRPLTPHKLDTIYSSVGVRRTY